MAFRQNYTARGKAFAIVFKTVYRESREFIMPKKREDDKNNLLRSFRALRNLTQQESAKKTGISRTLWSAWEGKTRPINIAHLNQIQAVLDLSDDQVTALRKWWGDACFDEEEVLQEGNDVEIEESIQ